MFENVDGRQTTDGRWSHWYTISSPMSLQLRRAKSIEANAFYKSNIKNENYHYTKYMCAEFFRHSDRIA